MLKNIGVCLICIILLLSNIFVFTTLPSISADSLDNICPTAINPTITNQSKYIDIDIGWFNITVYDDDGNNTYGNITCSNGDTCIWSNQPNGTKSLELDNLYYYVNYTIWLNFTDSTCTVNNTYWFITQDLPPNTLVNYITYYWQDSVPEVNIYATNYSFVDNVTLYYRSSTDNISWGNWTKWIGFNNPDDCGNPWAWTFDCPSGSGYYEFYSIGVNNSSYEIAPITADARCHVNKSVWVRFGNQQVGCYPNELYVDPVLNHNYIQGSNFTCPSDGVADSMYVWIRSSAYPRANITCAIYTADEGVLVGTTEVKNIGYIQDWVSFDFFGEPSLVVGTKYLLVVWGDNGYIRYDDDVTNDFNGYALNYTGAFPSSIADYEHINDFVVSIYCRYTELPDEPSSFTASADNRTQMTLSWDDAVNADYTRIEWNSVEDITWLVGDHTLLYNGSAETTTHSGLVPGQTVYYKAWSYNITSDMWSGATTTSGTTDSNNVSTVFLLNPSNNTTDVGLSPLLNISISDYDNDIVTVVFYNYINDNIIGIDTVLGNGYASTVWSGLDNNTSYKWYVTVDDGYDNLTKPNGTDSFWSFTTSSITNNPPFIPSHPNPINHATSINIDVNLSWLSGDPDCGNTVTYDIYFGTNSNPSLLKSNHTSTIYDLGTLNSTTKYYWKIIAKDNHELTTTGPIWDFTTIFVNQPPNTPYNPNPKNGKNSINIDQDLSWSGGDQDAGDTVTYDVYFGYILPTKKVASNISTPTYNPGILNNSLTYYWKIVSWDNHGLSTNGPIWYFITINATNKPPNKPNKPSGINSGKIGTTHSYSSSTTDPNGDFIYYWFDWGDGTNSGWEGPYNSGDNVTLAHSWTRFGTYPIKVKAKDTYGNESVWSNPLVINIPKTKISNLILLLKNRIFEYFPIIEKIINLTKLTTF